MTADKTNNRLQELKHLEARLLTHGTNLERWPESEQAWATALMTCVPAVRQKFDEARALDQVLDLADSRAPTPHNELVDRIVAAAMSSTESLDDARSDFGNAVPDQAQVTSGQVIPFTKSPTLPRATTRDAPTASSGTVWQAAAVLVAALALGVVLGVSDFGRPTVRSIVVAAGMASDQDQEYGLLEPSPLSPSDEELQ